MIKIIITDRDKTLTIYASNNFYENISKSFSDQHIENLASQLFELSTEKNEIIFLNEILLAGDEPDKAKVTYYKKSAQFSALETFIYVKNESATRQMTIEHPESVDNDVLDIICALPRPPLHDDEEEISIPDDTELRHVVVTRLLQSISNKESANEILSALLDNPEQMLLEILDQCFGDIPKDIPPALDAQLKTLRREIPEQAKKINAATSNIVEVLGEYIKRTARCNHVIDRLAATIHGAAADFYAARWALCHHDIAALKNERSKINEIFAGFAHIKDDFTLCPLADTREFVAMLFKADTPDLCFRVSALLNRSYNKHITPDAFYFLAEHINVCENFEPVTRQIWYLHKFDFSQAFKKEIRFWREACRDLDELGKSETLAPVFKIIQQITHDIRTRARGIQQNFSQYLQPRRPAFSPEPAAPVERTTWQKHRGKILGAIFGVLIGAGVAVGLYFALPVLIPAAAALAILIPSAVGAALLIAGISTSIGAAVDHYRNTHGEAGEPPPERKRSSTHVSLEGAFGRGMNQGIVNAGKNTVPAASPAPAEVPATAPVGWVSPPKHEVRRRDQSEGFLNR